MSVAYSEKIKLSEPGPVFFARAAEAFRRLGWEVKNYQPNMLAGSKGMNMWTWGENYYLKQIGPDEVEITMENPMALWDPFKAVRRRGRKMIKKLLNMIDNVPPPASLPPMPPMADAAAPTSPPDVGDMPPPMPPNPPGTPSDVPPQPPGENPTV